MKRPKVGEVWLAAIDDKIDLKKVRVEAIFQKTVQFTEIVRAGATPEAAEDDFLEAPKAIETTVETPSRFLRWDDIEFVEKL